jgi:hypothetical protein
MRESVSAAGQWLCLLLTVTLMPGPALAAPSPPSAAVPTAGLTCAQPVDPGPKGKKNKQNKKRKQDAPIVDAVDGSLAVTDLKALREWLVLLAGRYSFSGYVDLCGQGHATDQRPVTGSADCILSGPIPDVHCKVDADWPETRAEDGAPVLGGVSGLRQAQLVYSLENSGMRAIQVRGWGIQFVQVDNKGKTDWASGVLVGDTFTAGELCVGIPGSCQKITRITARPGSNEISMLIEIQIDHQPVMRQAFLLHRRPNLQQGYPSGDSP